MQHSQSLTRCWAAALPLRPLLYAAGVAVTATGVYYYFKTRGDEFALVESDLMCDVDGIRNIQTDSAVPENQKDEVSGAPMERDRSNLEDRVRELEELLSKTHRECEIKNKECEQVREAHSIMKSRYIEMTESVTHCEESLRNLQVTLSEAERKYEQVIESNAQLKKENSNLRPDLTLLQDWAHEQEKALSKIKRRNNKIRKECKHERKAHSILKLQYNEMKETFTQNEESLKLSLADVEEKYELVNASFAHLESYLMSQVSTLQASVQQLEEELCETRRKCDEITIEREHEQEVHSILKLQYQEMRENLEQCRELLKNRHISLGSEEPVVL
ncbi:centrosomal protein of 83 kDa-like [Neoarius graeffei]|uniref:centrosomal protein of 83 kDa-like n=1 Tax=Neoarius graeffei TaxID=443677 RepID=UPI00298C2F1F|nr:centrosomal protein of 83 kDa-like [Neoarius graeffei]